MIVALTVRDASFWHERLDVRVATRTWNLPVVAPAWPLS